MIRKILFLFIMVSVLLLKVSLVQAADPSPGVEQANCDICGYCSGPNLQPPYDTPPSDWKRCVQCVYPSVYTDSITASQNITLNENVIPDVDNHYTVLGCISTKPGAFVAGLSSLLFRIIGGIAFLFLLYGAFLVTTSRGDYEKLNQGKKMIYGAIAGLLFVLFATFIIRFIAVNVLRIPGFG